MPVLAETHDMWFALPTAHLTRSHIDDDWKPDGVTFFVRDGRLAFDIGWVGAVEGATPVADGRWHHVAVSFEPDQEEVVLWVDGEEDAVGSLSPEGSTIWTK